MSDPRIDPEKELETQLEQELSDYHGVLNTQEDAGLFECFREELSEEEADKEADTYIKASYMNNFYTRFPGREGWSESMIGDMYRASKNSKRQEGALQTASEEGADLETIKDCVEEFLMNGFDFRKNKKYVEIFWPLYKKMRSQGYSHKELIG